MYDRGETWYRKPEYVVLDARLRILCERPVTEFTLSEWFATARGVVLDGVKQSQACHPENDIDGNDETNNNTEYDTSGSINLEKRQRTGDTSSQDRMDTFPDAQGLALRAIPVRSQVFIRVTLKQVAYLR
ncbi:hypothetical protein FOL47_001132 [Perkinsus chesapeaki]|uniref:Uncharacterized protein n=1 Tax=Perkinsus chesapeaki TaxID=330153 RepID=A0A7J6KTF7_PERCH|nr:hypothetical protein FOL47_001132 [Perkinsus chesapeaki]